MSANSFKNHFKGLTSNADANKQLDLYRMSTEIEDDDQATEAKLKELTREQDSIILTFNSVTEKCQLLHSIANLGGTPRRPANKIVAIEGFGPAGTPVLLPATKFLSGGKTTVPTDENLLGVTQTADVAQLDAEIGNYFKNARFINLPPCIYVPYLELRTRDPSELLVETLSIINEFDTNNTNIGAKKAKAECLNVLKYLWIVASELSRGIPFSSVSDDNEVQDWSKTRHNACILSPPPHVTVLRGPAPEMLPNAVFHELSGSIRNNTLVMEKFRQENSEARSEKKNIFGSLHDSAQLLILNASSTNGEFIPTSPVQTCKEFYEKSTVGKAMDFFDTTMKEKFNCYADISTGFITALYTGKFLRERSDSPSNFSFFLVPKLKPLSSGFSEKAMILQLKTSQGKGWSDNDLKEAVKQGIITPTSQDEFRHQLKNLWGTSSFFFGENSKIAT